MLRVAIFDDYDVALFSVHSSHLIPFLKICGLIRRRKPVLVLDIRTIPVDLVNDLRSKFELFRFNASIKIAHPILLSQAFAKINPFFFI